jgi:hypothetical protein
VLHLHLLKPVLRQLPGRVEGKARIVDEEVELVLLGGEILGKLVDGREAGQIKVHHSQLSTDSGLLRNKQRYTVPVPIYWKISSQLWGEGSLTLAIWWGKY